MTTETKEPHNQPHKEPHKEPHREPHKEPRKDGDETSVSLMGVETSSENSLKKNSRIRKINCIILLVIFLIVFICFITGIVCFAKIAAPLRCFVSDSLGLNLSECTPVDSLGK